jgi:hypothetical protein
MLKEYNTMNSLPMIALELELCEAISDDITLMQRLFTEIRDLRESNRVALDVFRSAPEVIRHASQTQTLDTDTVCQLLTELIQSLEMHLKESDSCL